MRMHNLIIIKSTCGFDAVSRQFERRASDERGLTSELIELLGYTDTKATCFHLDSLISLALLSNVATGQE